MAAKLVDRLPEGPAWLYELKFDGYRALLLKNGPSVQLRSRNDKDLGPMYPGILAAARRLRAERTILDGEVVALDPEGRPSFQALQHRSAYPHHTVFFYAFDVLHVEGRDLISTPLADRRARLPVIVGESGVLLSEELSGSLPDIIDAVRALGLEGIVAKRRDSRYIPGGRSDAWRKLKLDRQQEFVVGGYRPGPHGVDALLVGFYEGKKLRFAGKVRAGFTPRLRREVFSHLGALHAPRCPFVDLPHASASRWGGGVTAEQMQEMQWLKPSLVVQIRFVEWTAEAHLRHAAFVALRADKAARDVRRE
jgi:DNA ligase D-like protein (predicted ligase)